MDKVMSLAVEDPGGGHWFTRIAQQLSVVTVIIIIAGGLLTCLLLFIFAKRQIMRFALRSHRGPHVPFGTDANKAMRKEILRRIEALPKITYEPRMLREDENDLDYSVGDNGRTETEAKIRPCHYFRMKALDNTKSLEQSLIIRKLGKRQSFESLRCYLMLVFNPQVDPRIIHQFCDVYEAARFNPEPFKEEDYKLFRHLLQELRTAVSILQPKSIRSPAKSSTTMSKKAAASLLQEDDSFSKNAPYMRRSSKESKRGRWSFQRSQTEEQPLCESATSSPPRDPISPGSKAASTVTVV